MSSEKGTGFSQSPSSLTTDSPAIPRTPLSSLSHNETPATPIHRGELSGVSLTPSFPSSSPYSNPMNNNLLHSQSDSQSNQESSTVHTDQTIWSTNISTTDLYNTFYQFINEFKRNEDDEESYYISKIKEVLNMNLPSVDIDCHDLYDHEPTQSFYTSLCNYPLEVIPIADVALNELIKVLIEGVEDTIRLQTRFFNLKSQKTMRDLGPDDILRLISIRGMITRVGDIIPDMKQATFRCSSCQSYQLVDREGTRVQEPDTCPICHSKNSFQILHNLCVYSDKQLVKMQETPNMIPEGETPQNVSLYSYDDNVDRVKPGDRVEITGIFRAYPVRVRPTIRTVRSIFRTYIDVLHYKQLQRSEINDKEDVLDFEKDEMDLEHEKQEHVRQMKAIASDPQIYEKLTQSIAPSIWGMEDTKKGILCMLFGGTPATSTTMSSSSSNQNNSESESQPITEHAETKTEQHVRSEINILLCGDPGTSKSQLLNYVNKIAPRGIYTSGKGSSAVGLTAYVTKDPETGELILESGALVLSDKGICCIDEFDKMDDSTRAILHEAMEQQTISIAKAGIICSLNSRTSILAAANPVNSRYDTKLSVLQNLLLPASLLSRFDLIYLILDNVNKESDRRLAKHIISLFSEHQTEDSFKPPFDMKTLTSYIAFAKENCFPVITEETAVSLRDAYLELRRVPEGAMSKKLVSATPRQLESLIRLSESLAKMRLSNTVDVCDVEEAHRLMNVATQKAAVDPQTGIINIDTVYGRNNENIINDN